MRRYVAQVIEVVINRLVDWLDPPAQIDYGRVERSLCPFCTGYVTPETCHVHGGAEVHATSWPNPGVMVTGREGT